MTEKSKILGILGGGQLGRMAALAAANLGIQTHIYTDERNSCASQVTSLCTYAAYDDKIALDTFAQSVDFISYEFENIPLIALDILQSHKKISPSRHVLEICQDRIKEKRFLNENGVKTTRWAECNHSSDIPRVLNDWKAQKCILKTARLGYDGKGQLKHHINDNASENFSKLQPHPLVIEEIVDFTYEASILVARDITGRTVLYPPTINEHENHILSRSRPSGIDTDVLARMNDIALSVATNIDLLGLLAIEFFVTGDNEVLVNEMAPRPHNSGHWTMDGCDISQFENYVRAVCGLPVIPPRQHSDVMMINLIGDDIRQVPDYLSMDNVKVHLYGKGEARLGRKMGHVNIVKPLKESA